MSIANLFSANNLTLNANSYNFSQPLDVTSAPFIINFPTGTIKEFFVKCTVTNAIIPIIRINTAPGHSYYLYLNTVDFCTAGAHANAGVTQAGSLSFKNSTGNAINMTGSSLVSPDFPQNITDGNPPPLPGITSTLSGVSYTVNIVPDGVAGNTWTCLIKAILIAT